MSPCITAVCVVHELLNDPGGAVGRTAIDKRSVPGAVAVNRLGLSGDTQCDTKNHGGPFQALYAYAEDDAAWWAEQLGRPVPPGLFGENLRLSGLDLGGALIGERWQLGDGPDAVVARVTKPRIPCQTFTRRMAEPHWVKRFADAGRVGTYLAVEREGTLEAGAAVTLLDRPAHGVTVDQAFRRDDSGAMRRLLAAADAGELELDPDLRRRATVVAERV